MHHIKFISMLC